MTGRGGVGGKGPRQMGSHAGGADDHAESPLPGGLGELSRLGRRPVGAEDMGLIGDVQGVQLGTGPFDHGPVTVAAHDDGNFFSSQALLSAAQSFFRMTVWRKMPSTKYSLEQNTGRPSMS